jgi:hypothetical protein
VWLALGLMLAGCSPRKKLIEFGWDIPDTTFLRAHLAEMEQAPFDGCVFQVTGVGPNGEARSLSWQAWGRRSFRETELASALEDLRALRPRRFRDNFLRLNVTPGDLDWFDDFAPVLTNARLAARLARAGRVRGMLLDVEQYEARLFDYARQRDAATRSFDAYAAQARRRGRELMHALEAEQPGLRVFLTFGYSVPAFVMRRDGVTLAGAGYGLLAAFLDGLVEGTRRGRIVDGYELSYGFREPKQFAEAYEEMRRGVLPIVRDPVRYRGVTSFGFGIWLDYEWRANGWSADAPERNYFTPERFEQVARAALEASDEYVWIYSETPRWWSPAGGRVNLPDAYVDALRRARAAVSESPRRPR